MTTPSKAEPGGLAMVERMSDERLAEIKRGVELRQYGNPYWAKDAYADCFVEIDALRTDLAAANAAKAEAERKPKAVPPDQITAAVAMCRAWSEQNKDDFALSNAQSHIANMIERMGLLLGAAEKGRDHWSERAEYLHNALDDKHVALSEAERRLATAREALDRAEIGLRNVADDLCNNYGSARTIAELALETVALLKNKLASLQPETKPE